MVLWLSILFEIRWMAVYRSGQIEDRFLRIYCSKRGTLGGLRYSYPPKASIHFKELGRRPFCILLIYIEVIVGGGAGSLNNLN